MSQDLTQTDPQRQHGLALSGDRRRIAVGATPLLLAVVLYLVATQNDALWQFVWSRLAHPLDVGGAALMLALALLLIAGTFTVAAAICIGPFLRAGLALLVVVAVVCNYFMSRYGVLIDVQMLVNATRTDAREAGELMSAGLLHQLAWFAAVPALAILTVPVRRRTTMGELLQRAALVLLFIGLAGATVAVNYKEVALWARANSALPKYANPVYPLVSAYKLVRSSLIAPVAAAEFQRIGGALSPRDQDGRRRVIVMVVGETARADHFSLYGYDRETNPELAAIPALLRFDDVRSCGTSTAVSVPCMFSRLDRKDFERSAAESQENLLDILARAGVTVLWRENNTGCQGVCTRIESEELSATTDPALCTGGECRDAALLRDLRERLLRGSGDQLVVLHQLGSHGPSYYKRYPSDFARFTPECALDDAYRCATDALVNSYDNTILYTDHILAEVIRVLESIGGIADTAMLYVSDHGESLGENGVYLHGFPYALAPDAQTRVPMLAWLSPSFIDNLSIELPCLQDRLRQPVSHDHVFDLVLGLFDVGTPVYRAPADVIGQCRSQR